MLVPAYNLEPPSTRTGASRSAWGAFPALTGYFVEAQTIRLEAVAAAGYARAQPRAASLSTPVRAARRERARHAGTEPLESALRAARLGFDAIAVGLVAARLR